MFSVLLITAKPPESVVLNIMLSSVFSGVCVSVWVEEGGVGVLVLQRQGHVIVITRFSTCLILCNLVLQFSWQIFGTDKEWGVMKLSIA